jgi:hypothetical protein
MGISKTLRPCKPPSPTRLLSQPLRLKLADPIERVAAGCASFIREADKSPTATEQALDSYTPRKLPVALPIRVLLGDCRGIHRGLHIAIAINRTRGDAVLAGRY